jgi:hypothetical protein
MSRKNTARVRDDTTDAESTSEEETGFFASHSAKITKSKWLAFHGDSSSDSDESSDDDSNSDGDSSSTTSGSSDEDNANKPATEKPAHRFLKDSTVATKGIKEDVSSSDASSDDSLFPSDSDENESSDLSEDVRFFLDYFQSQMTMHRHLRVLIFCNIRITLGRAEGSSHSTPPLVKGRTRNRRKTADAARKGSYRQRCSKNSKSRASKGS